LNGHGPLFEDIAIGQEKRFTNCFGGGKNAFGLGDFAQLAMVAFHGIGGVDQALGVLEIALFGLVSALPSRKWSVDSSILCRNSSNVPLLLPLWAA